MAEGTQPLPSWLGSAATLVTQVGVPTVVAGVLLWFVLSKVDAALYRIQQQEDFRTTKVVEMQAALIAAIERQADRFDAAIDKNIASHDEHMRRLERAVGGANDPVR